MRNKQILEMMNELGTKFCHKCSTIKSETAFGKDKHRSDGLTTRCKECRNKANIEYFSKHPEVREKHNVRNRGKRKRYYADPERKLKYKDKDLQYTYGITLNDYNNMLEVQNGVCAICKKPEMSKNGKSNEISRLAVDHCHKTGKIRGLLCLKCNHGIGNFNDDILLIDRAISYLKGDNLNVL